MSHLARLDFVAELTGAVNGQPIDLYGEGSILAKDGVTSGAYRLREMPNDLDPRFLSGCLITGYPNACAAPEGSNNPFGSSAYSYQRHLDFGEVGNLTLDVDCSYVDGLLRSRFKLLGKLDAESLDTVDTIHESWSPGSQPFLIDGSFEMVFRSTLGSRVTKCLANSQYRIEIPPSAIRPLTRSIDIRARLIDQDLLTLFQESRLSE